MKFLRNLKHIFLTFAIALSLIVSVGIFVVGDEFTDSINSFLIYRTGQGVWQDLIHKHTLSPSDDIVIIKIDEKTLNALQAKNTLKMLSIPKQTYAELIEKLESVGVRGVAFDIMFQNADTDEGVFADTIAKYDNIVIGAQYVDDFCTLSYDSVWIQLGEGELRNKYPKSVQSSACEGVLRDMLGDLYATKGTIIPQYDTLRTRDDTTPLTDAEKLGVFCTHTEDGVIDCPGLPRSIYSSAKWGMININSAFERPIRADITTQPYRTWKTGTGSAVTLRDLTLESLPLALYSTSHTGSAEVVEGAVFARIPTGNENTRIESLPTVLQPYFGGPEVSYRQVSLIDVLSMSSLDMLANFADKYVLIGESGTHINDSKTSPVTGTQMDGVETHAHMLDGLLQNKMLVGLDEGIMLFLVIVLVLVSVFVYFYVPKYLSPICAIAIILLLLWISRILYDNERILLDISLLLLAGGIITYPVTYIYRFFVVDREKRELQDNFGHYIDPHVVEEIASRGEDIVLGGERRVLSVLFSDIAGFTTISESLDPQELFYLMTSYLSNMTDILIGEGGTLDKYIGDAVMGFFGAPLSYTDHATRACRTALAMRAKLPLFNTDLVAHGMKPIDFRVGIATGEVMVGNIGSHDRFNYTVLGDTVNLASRLEGTGKEYDVHIIIASATRGDIPDEFVVRELDTIAVKGKTEGIQIYELLGYKKDITDMSLYIQYEKALTLYRSENYLDAGQLWESQMDIDPPSRIMALRCVSVLKGELQVENGVYHMTHK